MNRTARIVAVAAVIAVVLAAGVFVAIGTWGGEDEASGETVTDFAGREVTIPEDLDNGIVTIGRLSALRWLAYFPEEMEKVVMIDTSLQTSIEGGALAYSYAYADLLRNVAVHSNDNLDEAERIVGMNPSLILVNDSTYYMYSDACESLAKLIPLAVVDTMGDLEGKGFWDADHRLCDRFVKQANLYGKLLRNETRAEEVKSIFQDAIDEIVYYSAGEAKYTTYIAGPINQGSNPLTSTYNPYPTLSLANGKNALGSETQDYRIDNSPEYIQILAFDCMVVDPSVFGVGKGFDGPQIYSPNSEGVLLDIYNRNSNSNADDNVKIFITLPTISHGANWDCVLAGAYFMAYLNHDGLDYDTMLEKASGVFVSFYGEAGAAVLEGIMNHYHNSGMNINPVCDVQIFGEVVIEKKSNKYVLTEVPTGV